MITVLLSLQFQSAAQKKINHISPFQFQIQKKVTGRNGAVVSAHPLASKVGLSILQQGGNAVDAAIAVQLALAVVHPSAGNIGGGGFMIAHLSNGRTVALDYREKAPGKASRDMYLDSMGKPNMALSQDGHLSCGVPGTIAGLFASMKYAKLPFVKLIQPAINLAEKGFALTEKEAASLNGSKQDFLNSNINPPIFVREGGWKAGDTLIQKDLAGTLKRIRDLGQKGFYEGETARLIVAEMKKANGIISYEDLQNYHAIERKPVQFNYKGYEIISMPLPSSGGLILQQCMKMVEDRNIGSLGFQSPAAVQLMVEAERRAFADRAKYLGDPDFVKVPINTLISAAYLQERMKDFVPGVAGNSKSIGAGMIPHESMETTHLSIVDKWGNAASVTTTLNNGYGSKTVIEGAGFIMNDEMDDFSVKPGVPNMFGAIGGEANAIAPAKRMLSSMTPAIVLKNRKPFLVTGTPGGTTIPTSVYQTILNIIEFNLSTEDAVNLPKFHHQWLPDVIIVEQGFPAATIQSLHDMGYQTNKAGSIGRTELIRITNGNVEAVGDRRGDDDAEGY